MYKPIIFALLLTICTSFSARSQEQDDQKQVLQAVEKLKQAMLSGDGKALELITAENMSYWHSNGKLEDKAAFIRSLTSGESDFVAINLTEQSVKISNDIAIIHHIMTAKTNDGGVPGQVKIGVLLVFQKSNTIWKLFARQAFKLPS